MKINGTVVDATYTCALDGSMVITFYQNTLAEVDAMFGGVDDRIETECGIYYNKKLKEIRKVNGVVEAALTVSAASYDDITDLQCAIAELAELIVGGDEEDG